MSSLFRTHGMSVWDLVSTHKGLMRQLSIPDIVRFLRLIAHLKQGIISAQPNHYQTTDIPDSLPAHIISFLSNVLELPNNIIEESWTVLGSIAWDSGDISEQEAEDRSAFGYFGYDSSLLYDHLYPPFDYCPHMLCDGQKFLLRVRGEPKKIVLHTLKGARPALATHSYCPKCQTTYYNNFAISLGVRTYYRDIPDFIQVADHHYVERRLGELFIGQMLYSWTSATNACRIYNDVLSHPPPADSLHPDWANKSFHLRTEHVWDTFLILSLLEWHNTTGLPCLAVKQQIAQSDRYAAAALARNREFEILGQPEFGHYCDRCMRVWFDEDGEMEAVHALVVDGISIGHFCCNVFHCPEPLASQRDRFCQNHKSRERICAIEDCERIVDAGFLSCDHPEHRAMEKRHEEQATAMFTLQKASERSKISRANDSLAPKASVEEDAVDAQGRDCPAAKDPSGNRKITALWGHRSSHNQQVCVRPCQVVVAVRKFFGSEALSQVHNMLEVVFSDPRMKPDVIFYDNGCGLYRHLRAQGSSLADTCGFPVDVFHWTTKHKKSDDACSIHCNPYTFTELHGDDGARKWRFNSSAAEQINAWLGGYHAILKEMGDIKFDFFLDEMVMRRNRLTVEKLEKEGSCPSYIPGVHYGT